MQKIYILNAHMHICGYRDIISPQTIFLKISVTFEKEKLHNCVQDERKDSNFFSIEIELFQNFIDKTESTIIIYTDLDRLFNRNLKYQIIQSKICILELNVNIMDIMYLFDE